MRERLAIIWTRSSHSVRRPLIWARVLPEPPVEERFLLPPPVGNLLLVDQVELGSRIALHSAGEVIEFPSWPMLVAKLFPNCLPSPTAQKLRMLAATSNQPSTLRRERFGWPTNLLLEPADEDAELVVGYLASRGPCDVPIEDEMRADKPVFSLQQLLALTPTSLAELTSAEQRRDLYFQVAETITAAHENGFVLGEGGVRQCALRLDWPSRVFIHSLEECTTYDEASPEEWADLVRQDLLMLERLETVMLGSDSGPVGTEIRSAMDSIMRPLGIPGRGSLRRIKWQGKELAALHGNFESFLKLRSALPREFGSTGYLADLSMAYVLAEIEAERPAVRQNDSTVHVQWNWPPHPMVTAMRIDLLGPKAEPDEWEPDEEERDEEPPLASEVATRSENHATFDVPMMPAGCRVRVALGGRGDRGHVFGPAYDEVGVA